MGSADFSQFVVTTANETACETSTLKVRALFPHLPATSTGTSSNFWTSSLLADLSVFPSLICGSCPSGQGFAYSFLQIPPHDGHPCCSAMYFVVAYAYSGLSPVRARPWRANQKTSCVSAQLVLTIPVVMPILLQFVALDDIPEFLDHQRPEYSGPADSHIACLQVQIPYGSADV